MNQHSKNNKAFILIITIIFLSTTTFSIWYYLNKANLHIFKYEVALRKIKSSHLATSAFNLALTEIKNNPITEKEISIDEHSYFSYSISAENAKLNINKLINNDGVVDKGLEKVFLNLIKNTPLSHTNKNILYDWIDHDDIKRSQGAENNYYLQAHKHNAANKKIISLDEILLLKDTQIAQDELLQISDFITLTSNGKININHARKELLMALHHGITRNTAKNIIKAREAKQLGFANINQIKKVAGITNSIFTEIKQLISIENNYFLIYALGRYKNTKTEIKAIVEKQSNNIKLITYREI